MTVLGPAELTARTGFARTRTTSLITIREGGWRLSGTSIVQRGKRFAVVAYAGIDPETKRERRKWFGGFKTRREADQFRLTLAHHPSFSSGVGPYGSPRLRTGDYLVDWLQERDALGKLRVRTTRRHNEHIRLHLSPTLGHIPLSRLSPPAIQQMYIRLIAKGFSPATVRRAATVLHAALNDAVHRGLISHNPADNTTMPTLRKYEPTVLSEEQVLAYLEDARQTATPSICALYTTAAGTGMRLGELLGTPENAVDLPRRLLHVHQTLVRAGAAPIYGQPKSERGRRTILLPEVAVAAIRAALLWKKEQRLKVGTRWHDAGLLFCGPRGRPIHLSNLHKRDHRPRLARLGLPPTRIHDLRHFHATFLIASGIDPRTSADRLGHSSASFMLKTYAHAVARAQEQAAAVANDLLTRSAGVQR